MGDMGCVYGLADPRTMQTRYVGESSHDSPFPRLGGHIGGCGEQSPLAEWIRELLASGTAPISYTIEAVPDSDNPRRDKTRRLRAEDFWISWHRAMGSDLLNKVVTPEERSARSSRGAASMDPEARRQRSRKGWTVQKQAAMTGAYLALSPERRSEIARKSWKTRLGGRPPKRPKKVNP